ncbi:MAG: glycosyltransferase [Hamadaea sp.]|nr:glycosyltransferase [Hamadaea sp.]
MTGLHIVEIAYEATAFDVRLTRGGTATMVWELSRKYATAGHRVSVVSPAHGNADYLVAAYGAVEVGAPDVHTVPVVLDPAIWSAHAPQVDLTVRTRTLLVRREGVDLYFLSNEYLDLLPDTLYPANEMQGSDLAYLKPLVFQVDAIRFVDRVCGDDPAVVQCYEPAYHHLVPPVMRARTGKTTVSTVVVNTRIDDVVYRPQLERLLRECGADLDLDRYAQVETDDPLSAAMRDYHRPSYLKRDLGPDYVNYFAMVADCADVVDFVSPGQRDYYATFRDAPFEARFQELGVARVVRDTAAKQVVGGCALPDWWLGLDPAAVDRAAVLAGLGLRPDRPTFYHAARLAQNHKGQVELFRAIDAVLRDDRDVNFVVRCAVAAGGHGSAAEPRFEEIARRYPDNVHLDWRMVDERVLFAHTAAADFCLFPSKFELDGFLITMAEAMACGAVPIATAQETLSHYRHTLPLEHPYATGFAVPRSFRTDDRAMADRLAAAIRSAVRLFRDDPSGYARLSANCVSLARTFTWDASAAARLAHFGGVLEDPRERAIEYGWFDQLDDEVWTTRRDRVREAALRFGDLTAYRRCSEVDPRSAAALFDAAFARADFARCADLADLVDSARGALLRDRCRIVGDRVVYTHPDAAHVDLIVPAALSTGVGSGNRHTYPLSPGDEGFTAALPAALAGRDLVFLLTLTTGRVAWDLVPHPL